MLTGTSRTIAGAALLGVWLLIAVADPAWRPRGDGFYPAARQLRATLQPGDTLATRDQLGFWALMWGYEGSDWGAPLTDHVNNPRWAALIDRLPAPLRTSLATHLETHWRNGASARLLAPDQAWPDTPGDLVVAATVNPPTAIPGRVLVAQSRHAPVTLQRWRRAAR